MSLLAVVIGMLAFTAAAPSDDETQAPPGSLGAPHLQWLAKSLRSGGNALAENEARNHIAPAVFAAAGEDNVQRQFRSLARTTAHSTHVSWERTAPRTQSRLRVSGNAGESKELVIDVEPWAPHRITAVRAAAPAPDFRGTAGRPLTSAWLVSTGQRDCAGRTGARTDEQLPVASVAKLYVVAATVDAVLAGEHRWDTPVAVTAASPSLPPSSLVEPLPSATVHIRDLVELVMLHSDNTAADLLLTLLGRPAVEHALAKYGHSQPSATTPFLSTAEGFKLLWATDPNTRTEYQHATPERRRHLLDNNVTPLPLPDRWAVGTASNGTPSPWSASLSDVCRLLSRLNQKAATDLTGTTRTLLTVARGGLAHTDRWPHATFKAGKEPGSTTAAWYLEAPSGQAHVVVLWQHCTSTAPHPHCDTPDRRASLVTQLIPTDGRPPDDAN